MCNTTRRTVSFTVDCSTVQLNTQTLDLSTRAGAVSAPHRPGNEGPYEQHPNNFLHSIDQRFVFSSHRHKSPLSWFGVSLLLLYCEHCVL